MKKYSILIIILTLTACNQQQPLKKEQHQTNPKEQIIEEEKENYIDTNPIKLGFYMYYNPQTNRTLLTEYTTTWELNKDLCSLEIYYTNEPSIPGTNQKKLWYNYINNYENINHYRIGYNINFQTQNDGIITKTILSPKDTDSIYSYMQIYLYDDINQQDNAWYSHITEEEYTKNNILTSIKLTGSTKTNEITSNITLTAFTYDEDDFDKDNNYQGISKSTIIIKRS